MSSDILLAIDQGTSSSRAIGFSASGEMLAVEQQAFEQIYPASGWVEHDAEVIWATVLSTSRRVLQRLSDRRIAAIGITNQRETTVLWDRKSGAPIYHAIVWQDRRTADRCAALKSAHPAAESELSRKTGLLFDPYFSATKIAWILDKVPGARAAAKAGRIAFGTIDSFLLWRLTGGRLHATDATNASRTALYDLRKGCWDEALCELFEVPVACLPEVRDWRSRPQRFRRYIADTRRRRGSAGGAHRASMLRGRRGEEYLRDRRLPRAQHRTRARGLEEPAP
jgi:glycerol kinase